MTNKQDLIAKTIFDWLNDANNGDTPYSWEEDEKMLTINVDGYLDCTKLAAAISDKLMEDEAMK